MAKAIKIRNIQNTSERPRMDIARATVQKSVPILGVHEKYGLIETYSGCYTKMYAIGDNNYLTAPEEEQDMDYEGWKGILNSLGTNMEASLSIYNKSINRQEFIEDVLLKERGDRHDDLVKQMNRIIMDRVEDGKNGIQKEKYLTLAVHAKSASKAAMVFRRFDYSLDESLRKIRSFAKPVPIEERLEILFGIYNSPEEHLVEKVRTTDGEGRTRIERSFDFSNMRSMGLSVNDLIAPSSIEIKDGYMRLGEKYARTLLVSQFPSAISPEFFPNAVDTGFFCLTTMNYKAIPTKEADAIVAKAISLVRDEKQRMQKAGQKAGIYDDSYIDPSILDREAEALALREAMHDKDEHLFDTSLTVTVFADSLEKLDEYTEHLVTEYKKATVTLKTMTNQQEEGFYTTLPLCESFMAKTRTLTTGAAAAFMPFSTLELNDVGGINYSCNLISKNLIVYDRLSSANFNGFILGTPGAGKSFAAKTEILNVYLKGNADVILIDPEDEYTALAKLLGGETIKIMPGGVAHINPMEIVSDYELGDEMNPVYAKADFVLKMMECILKSPFGIDSVQETIIDECVHALFEPFMVGERLRKIPEMEMPTLSSLQRELERRKEPEARELAMALRLYTGTGSLNAFGFQTNVHTKNRFVVYQIRDIGDRLKNLSMLAILDHIWNQIVQNRRIGRNTWFYVDEIYLLFQNEYSATFLNTLFRRARKYGGVPTGITQNVSPLLESPTARDMLQNCCFIEILAQAEPDREKLKGLLNLSEKQLSYITASPKGQGLLYTGQNLVPFFSQFPKDNDVYRCLTSDLKEIMAYEAQERREMARLQKEALHIA